MSTPHPVENTHNPSRINKKIFENNCRLILRFFYNGISSKKGTGPRPARAFCILRQIARSEERSEIRARRNRPRHRAPAPALQRSITSSRAFLSNRSARSSPPVGHLFTVPM
jgi:hypothetical protein